MNVLIACEESQAVCIAFREAGHNAYSCDIQECSGGHPEWHIKGDALWALSTRDWDLVIAHPPCTYLSNSGVCHLYNKDKSINMDRWVKMRDAAYFFTRFFREYSGPLCVENPVMHGHARGYIGLENAHRQVIQPWMFGHKESKATVLWLRNLPRLKETNNVYQEMMELPKNQRQRIHYMAPGPLRQKARSKTFPGIAQAMAAQWGSLPALPQ